MKMNVSDIIVKIMEKEGITDAFGIPGAGINGLYKYMAQTEVIKHYTVRHEECAVHAAGGYFRASHKIAAAICTSGPGATNFVTGLYTCNIDSIPVLALTGQAVTGQLGKDPFQCVDIAAICKPIAKATFCVTNPIAIPEVMREAFRLMREGKPGPVVVDLPLDVQNAEIDYDIDSYTPAAWENPKANDDQITEAIKMLKEAKNPVIIMGGGVVLADACEELVKFAEKMQIPVITTYQAKGCIPYNHPLNAGHCGIQVGQPIGNKIFSESDVVLGIGCRFTDRHTGAIGIYTENKKFIHINVCATELNKIFKADLAILSDAKYAIEALSKKADELGPTTAAPRVAELPKLRDELERKTNQDTVPIHPHRVFGEMNKVFDDDTMFTSGCGITQIWSGQLQKISKPKKYLASGGAGCLGYDIPGAFGAMIADGCKNKAVAVMGDFGFTFHVQELATAAKYDVPLIVVIVNNAYLGLIRQNQKGAYGYEYMVEMKVNQSGLIDYVKVAEGLGCEAERVYKPEEIAPAMERAKASKKPYVIDIVCDEYQNCSMGNDILHVKEW